MKKKIVTIGLICLMSLSLVACGGNSKQNKTEEKETNKQENTAENTDDMSQSEWMEKNGDDTNNGNKTVESININTDEVVLKYKNYKIIDSENDEGNPVKMLIVYLDFTNKMTSAMDSSTGIYAEAFQGGIELQGYGGSDELNDMKRIKDGATIKVGFMFELNDTETPVEFGISEGEQYQGMKNFSQKQKILLK